MKNTIYVIVILFFSLYNNTSYAKLTGQILVCTVHGSPYQEISLSEVPATTENLLMMCDTELGTILFNALNGGTTHYSLPNIMEPHNPECFDTYTILRIN